jgi:hypothetical protein
VKYFREILDRDVKGFYFRRGGGVRMENGEEVRMERYIHTIHAPADISQGGVHALFSCDIYVTCQSFSSASIISATSIAFISHSIGVADMSLSIVLLSIWSFNATCTDFSASRYEASALTCMST